MQKITRLFVFLAGFLGAMALFLLLPPGIAAADGEVPFGDGSTITTSADYAISVYAADVDGDGDMDVLSASVYDDKIAWYENDGAWSPTFTSHVITEDPDGVGGVAGFADNPASVYAADLDGDGDLDVLSASAYGATVAWYENDGAALPAFTNHVITDSATGAISVYATDVDGDGDIDVLSASYADNKIAWYENDGSPTPVFTSHIVVTTAATAYSVYAADMDSDGDMDILSSSAGDNKITWYENDGGSLPTFTDHTITSAALDVRSVYAADVDGDGDMDVLYASEDDDKIAWYENDGSPLPGFTDHTIATDAYYAKSVYATDMDGDGDVDVLSASNHKIAWYENDGALSPVFTSRAITTTAIFARSVYATDVDGDGDVDALSASVGEDKIAWYPNETIHHSAAFPVQAQAVITDGADSAKSVYAADVDGDGDMDVLSASYNDYKVRWYESDGGSPPAFTTHVITTTRARSVYAVDVDSDGDMDVLSASPNEIAWYENDGSSLPAFTSHVITDAVDNASAVYAADVDGDGDIDVLSASINDDKIAWYENDGGSPPTFTSYVITNSADIALSVYAADVDGDGDTDVLSTSQGDDKVAWYENDGASPPAFASHVIATTATWPESVYAADVDGDGDVDVLSASDFDDKIAWYENDGGAPPVFTSHVITTSADGAKSVYAADVDGDGDLDILSASGNDDKIAWYENDGALPPAFANHIVTTTADEARSVYAADVDGDGDLDVLSASSGDDKIAWYENRGGQLALATTDTASATINTGQRDDMLRIVVTHRGRSSDTDAKLITFELLFEESADDPLTTAEANALIENLHIYRDDGSDSFEQGADTLVTTIDTLSLITGTQTVTFLDGDPNARIAYGALVTYFVVPELPNNAAGQTPNQFRVTHISMSSIAEDWDHDLPLTLEFAPNTASSICTANAASTVTPTSVIISGPSTGVINTSYTFTATFDPTTMLPITYTWQATGQSPITHTSGLSDTATFTWTAPGAQIVTVAATDAEGAVMDTHEIAMVPEFEDIGAGLADVEDGSVAWGDYDDDGDLDILLTGYGSSGRISAIYRNDSGGVFTDISAGLTPVYRSSVAWGDYDNDGDLDILLTGNSSSGRVTQVYRNDGQETFAHIYTGLSGVEYSSVAWGDYDNDGDLDILMAGTSNSGYITQVYRNDGRGVFSSISAGLVGLRWGASVAWGDYDNDGDLDILMAGDIDSGYVTQVYRNDGKETFTDINATLPDVGNSSIAWGDYDNDGDLDILLTGYGSVGNLAEVFRNDGEGMFTSVGAGLPGVRWSSVAWGDYDNDGNLDILLTGDSPPDDEITKVYHNDGGGTFTEVGAGLTGVKMGSVAWGDYDDDGDLDILLTGAVHAGGQTTQIYRNGTTTVNTAPTAPAGLTAQVSDTGTGIILSWSAATDSRTPPAGLTYNLRVGVTPGGAEIVAPMALSTGYRQVPALGNANHGLTATLNITTPGTYYWSVQAIDTAFAGSPWATEGSFIIGAPTPLTSVTIDGPTTGAVGVAHTFIAAVSPPTATPPITYTWSPTPTIGQGIAVVTYTWAMEGFKVITVTVTNATGIVSDTHIITIGAVNQPPVANAGDDQVVTVNEVVALDGSGSTDPDGDALNYLWQQMGGPAVSFTPNLSRTTFTAPSFSAVLTFTLTVTDTGGLADTDEAVITVSAGSVNRPPTISDILNQSTDVGVAVEAIAFTVGDAETPAGALALAGALSNILLVPPANILFGGSGTDRTVTVTPTAGLTGTTTITITVSDGELAAHDVFVLAVGVNSPPEFTSTPLEAASVGQPYTYAVTAADADAGDVLTITAPTLPGWLTLTKTSTRTASLRGAPAASGDYPVVLQVTDGQDSASQPFSITALPSDGDYEPNDTCAQANFIPTDGTVQVHTFGAEADEDWVAFYATANITYVLEARVPPTSTADVVLEIHDSCEAGGSFDDSDPTFSPDIRLSFLPPANGLYYVRLSNYDPATYGDDARYHLSVRALQDTLPSGAVILVAGRLRAGDPLQDNIHYSTDAVYRFARTHGCATEQIAYLATDTTLDGVTGLPTAANLGEAITQWAVNKVGPERPLTLYLMDHGNYDLLYLDKPNQQWITPLDLDGWLDQLEAAVPGVKVNLVIEACYSGSFIDLNQTVSAPGRVIVASTSAAAVAYASQEGATFSDSFINGLKQGTSLYVAFEEGKWAVGQGHPDQQPWLDGDGDGTANEAEDELAAAGRSLACSEVLPQQNWPPHVAQAEIRALSGEQGEIWARVQDDDKVQFAWAVVYAPSWQPPASGEEMVADPLAVPLQPRGNGWYAIEYNKFDEIGVYRVVVYAVDASGLLARPFEVKASLGGVPVYPEEAQTIIEIPIAGYTSTLVIPARAVTRTTTFTYTAFSAVPVTPAPAGFGFAGRGFHLFAYQVGQLQTPFDLMKSVTITVRYSDADVDDLNEETLALYYRDGAEWLADGISVIARYTGQIVVSADHLTEFALFGQERKHQVYLPLVMK